MKKSFFTLKDVAINKKRVLVRVDFNVPLDKKGKITDDRRIRAALPTINYLLKKNAKVILLSHMGRPLGVDKKLRMNVVAQRLQKLLKKRITKLQDCVGKDVERKVKGMCEGDIILLENLRFHAEEEKNNNVFASELARLGQVYVNDAFGTMHRGHASVDAITHFLPSVAGFLVEKEIMILTNLLEHPRKPFVAILGGAKVSDKLRMIHNLLKKVDKILVGGAMTFTFLKSVGYTVGKSLVEKGLLKEAKELLASNKILLPSDVVVSKSLDGKGFAKEVWVENMPQDMFGVDIGCKTQAKFGDEIKHARTIFWNGPLGVCEVKKFAEGTEAIAKSITKTKAITVVGGGDSAAVVAKLKLEKKFTHVSTGGGATMEFLEGAKLPGIAALEKSFKRGL